MRRRWPNFGELWTEEALVLGTEPPYSCLCPSRTDVVQRQYTNCIAVRFQLRILARSGPKSVLETSDPLFRLFTKRQGLIAAFVLMQGIGFGVLRGLGSSRVKSSGSGTRNYRIPVVNVLSSIAPGVKTCPATSSTMTASGAHSFSSKSSTII